MKSFIICLSKIESSLSTAQNLKRQLEEFKMPAELFEGTYGTNAIDMAAKENRKMHPWGIKGPNAAFNPDDTSVLKAQSPGVLGCFYSHFRLWWECIKLNEPILIFEDDIVLTRPYIPVEFKDVLVVALGHPTKSERFLPYLNEPTGEPQACEYSLTSMPGCCGYAINPHAARKLVQTYAGTYLPADNAINQHHVTIQIHNYIMGIALIKKDGKQSLTRTKFWETYDNN